MDSDLNYQINDRVIVDWNGCLYEAKVINVKELENKKRYKVHFTNWSSKHDEWKDSFFIFPRTEENLNTLKEQREYIAQHNVKPKSDVKSGSSDKEKPTLSQSGTSTNPEKSTSKKSSEKTLKKSKSKESISDKNEKNTNKLPKNSKTGTISLKDNKNVLKVGKSVIVDSIKMKAKISVSKKKAEKFDQNTSENKKNTKSNSEENNKLSERSSGRNSPALSNISVTSKESRKVGRPRKEKENKPVTPVKSFLKEEKKGQK